MKKEDIIRKLTSRKFWLALIGFVTALLIGFNVDAASAEKITSIIMSFGCLIAYVLGEGFADGKGSGKGDDYDY